VVRQAHNTCLALVTVNELRPKLDEQPRATFRLAGARVLWGLLKWKSAPPYGPLWLGKTLALALDKTVYVKILFTGPCEQDTDIVFLT